MKLLDAKELLFIPQPVCLRSICVYELLFLLLKRLPKLSPSGPEGFDKDRQT